MANHARDPLQTRLFEIISQDATVLALLGAARVYDFVPDNPTFPYVTIADSIFLPSGSHTHHGFEVTATIHVWALAAGRKTGNAIAARIFQLLHDQDLEVPNFPTLSCLEIQNLALVEEDRKTHHNFCQYRILLAGNPA